MDGWTYRVRQWLVRAVVRQLSKHGLAPGGMPGGAVPDVGLDVDADAAEVDVVSAPEDKVSTAEREVESAPERAVVAVVSVAAEVAVVVEVAD